MYILKNLSKSIFVYLPILLLFVGIGIFVSKNAKDFTSNINRFITNLASEYIKTDLKIGSIKIVGNHVILNDVSIKDTENNPLIYAQKVNLRISPISIISKKIMVNNITLNNLKINIYRRKATNKWNYSFLEKILIKKEVKYTNVNGPVIIIKNGNIKINDEISGYKDNLSNINSRIDISNTDKYKVALNLTSNYVKNVNLHMDANHKKDILNIDLKYKNLDVNAFNYFKHDIKTKDKRTLNIIKNTSTSNGSSKGEIFISTSEKHPEKIKKSSAKIDLINLSAKSNAFNLKNTDLRLNVDNNMLTYNLKGNFNDASLTSSGQTYLSDSINKIPFVNINIELKNASIKKLKKCFSDKNNDLDGTLDLSLKISGDIKNPQIKCKTIIKDLLYNKQKLHYLALNAILKDKDLTYSTYLTTNNPFQGELYAKGKLFNFDVNDLDIKNITTESNVNVRKIDLSKFNLPYKVNANLNADFYITNNLTNPKIASNIMLSKGFFKLDKIILENIEIGTIIDYNNKELNIKNGVIRNVLDSNIIFNGKIDKNLDGNLNFSLNNLDLRKIAKEFDVEVNGDISLIATIKKVSKNISLKGLLNVSNFNYDKQAIDFAQVDFNIVKNKILINKCDILDLPATIQLNGYIKLLESTPNTPKIKASLIDKKILISKIPNIYKDFISYIKPPINNNIPRKLEFNLNCMVSNYSLETILNKLNLDYQISGISDANFNINGQINIAKDNKTTLTNMKGAGKINLSNITAYNYTFDNISTYFTLDNDILSLNKLYGEATTFNVFDTNNFGKIEGSGNYNIKTTELNGNINFSDLNINDIKDYYKDYVLLSGNLNGSCKIYGTKDKINANLDGNIKRLGINGKMYKDLIVKTSLRDSDLINANLMLIKDKQNLNISCKNYSIINKSIEDLSLIANNASVNDIREIFYLSPIAKRKEVVKVLNKIPVITDGEMSIDLKASGKIKELDGTCLIKSSNVNLDFDKLTKLEINLTADKGVINLPSLEMEGSEFVMTANALPLYDKDKINLNASIINLPLERFGKYFNLSGISGTLALDAMVTGNTTKPNVTMSLDVQKPVINNIKLQSISASKIDVDTNNIYLTSGINILLTDKNNIASITGTIPLSTFADNQNTNTENKELDLSLNMPEQEFAFIEGLIPQIEKDRTKGLFTTNAHITGSILKPKVTGEIKLSSAEVHTIGNMSFNNINSDIKIQNDDSGNILFLINNLSMSDNNNVDSAFELKDGYIKVANIGDSINNSNKNNRRSALQDILQKSEISLNAKFKNYYLTANNLSTYRDNTSCYINGDVLVKGNLETPNITNSGESIILDKLKCSFSTTSKTSETDNSLISIFSRKTQAGNQRTSYRNVTNEVTNQNNNTRNRRRNSNLTSLFNPTYNMYFVANNADIRPPSTIVKADANFTVDGTMQNPHVKGHANATEGRTMFQVARARIVRNSFVDFEYLNHKPVMNINANAFSYVHATDRFGMDQRYKIDISVTGGINDMVVNMVSDPEGLDNEQIIRAFGGIGLSNNKGNNVEINTSDILASIGVTNILSPIEDWFVENLGFDTFGFEYKQDNYAIINVEKSFGRNFYGSFYSNFYNSSNTSKTVYNNLAEWEVKLGYRLYDRFRINLGYNSDKEVKTDITYGIKF